jgi:hypothetical protein
MKTSTFVAAIVAALSFAGVAHASPSQPDASSGHYEWRRAPTYGPRAPLVAPRRVWVPDTEQMAMSGGHYEWRSGPSFGPKSPFPVRRRVWVPDHAEAGDRAAGDMACAPAASAG